MRAALRSRHDVIQRQMSVATAVLARMSVAAQNFPAIDRGHFPQAFPVTKSQADLFGYVDAGAGRSHQPAVADAKIQRFSLACYQKYDRPFDVDTAHR
jgi:hypothetical protein